MPRTITDAPHANPPLVLIVHTIIDYRSDQHARIWIHNRPPVHTTIHWGAQSLLHTRAFSLQSQMVPGNGGAA